MISSNAISRFRARHPVMRRLTASCWLCPGRKKPGKGQWIRLPRYQRQMNCWITDLRWMMRHMRQQLWRFRRARHRMRCISVSERKLAARPGVDLGLATLEMSRKGRRKGLMAQKGTPKLWSPKLQSPKLWSPKPRQKQCRGMRISGRRFRGQAVRRHFMASISRNSGTQRILRTRFRGRRQMRRCLPLNILIIKTARSIIFPTTGAAACMQVKRMDMEVTGSRQKTATRLWHGWQSVLGMTLAQRRGI